MESINVDLVDRLPGDVRRAATAAGLPAGRAWLLVEMGGEDGAGAAMAAEKMLEALRDSGSRASASLVTDVGAQAVLWRCRTDAAGLATRRADGAEAWGGWEDAAVPPERLADYLRGLDELMGRHGLSGASYGHFGEGCMHMRIDFDLLSRSGLAVYRTFVEEATDLVVSLAGSVSGEHGDGRARSELLGRMYGADGLRLLTEMKDIWDPGRVMNPGVIVDAPAFDAGIRHMGAAKDRKPLTLFAYPDDNHDFAQAQRRCVGIGKCRQSSGGVMCPSYQATHEEMHSTRGRAHLLWEMLEGDLVTDGWRSTEVRDALDLCLSCKGCLSDCPVNVDMATYKAEFTHHHYAGRPWARPASHWSMGWLPLWSRFASRAPRLVNRMARMPVAKRMGGIAPEREIPVFAERTFTSWFADRAGTGPAATRGRVVLWPDTFTNHLTPEVGRAAVEVLEAAGYEVVLPDRAGVLRADVDFHRTAAGGEATHQALSGKAGAAACSGYASCGFGAELPCGAAPRRGRTSAGRSTRHRPGGVGLYIRGVPHPLGLATATGRYGRPRADALSPACCPRLRRRPLADGQGGHQRRRPRFGMLRARWQFRLRKGPLRRVSRRGGTGSAAGGPGGRARDRDRRRRIQLPYADRAWHAEARGAPGSVARRRTARTLISCERSTQQP